MRHVPHIYVAPPWAAATIEVPPATRHHLERVLRRGVGEPITYTDGAGVFGSGVLTEQGVERGDEVASAAPVPEIVIAAAPPHQGDRARSLVEKVAEIGVDRLVWLAAANGNRRPPRPEKAHLWAVAALQQSRGDRLLRIDASMSPQGPWPPDYVLWVAESAAPPIAHQPIATATMVILIGPEGGFEPAEVPERAIPVSLGRRILRVETAAIVAAASLAARRREQPTR